MKVLYLIISKLLNIKMGNNNSQLDVYHMSLDNIPESLKSMKSYIKVLLLEKIDKLEEEHDITILWLVESGSRAWGMESENSDCDVRGVFMYNDPEKIKELTIPNNKVERVISGFNDDRMLDWQLWEEGFSLGHLKKKNACIVDWLHSDDEFVYYSYNNMFKEWQEKYSWDSSAVTKHYYGMMKSHFNNDVNPSRKSKTNVLGTQINKGIEDIQHHLEQIKLSDSDNTSHKHILQTHSIVNNIVKTSNENAQVRENDTGKNQKATTTKKLWYLIRPYLMLKYMETFPDNGFPPLDVEKLIEELEGELQYEEEIKTLLKEKKGSDNETETVGCPQWVLDIYGQMDKTVLKSIKKKHNSKNKDNEDNEDNKNNDNEELNEQ